MPHYKRVFLQAMMHFGATKPQSQMASQTDKEQGSYRGIER